MKSPAPLSALVVCIAWALTIRVAAAAEPIAAGTGDATSGASEEPTAPDLPAPNPKETRAIDRTWLYVDDAAIAPPLTVTGATSVSYTEKASDPDSVRPSLALNTAQPGALLSIGAEVGLLPRLSVMALGQGVAGGETDNPRAGAVLGLRVSLLPTAWRDLRLVASGGYLHEAWSPTATQGDDGAWGALALAGDIGRLRLGVTFHGQHVFAPDRDALDVMVATGATVAVTGPLRVGVEWVGQDLEETFQDEAEGGARMFIGPTASVQLLGDRLTIAGGPSFGLTQQTPGVLGRLALAYAF